MTTSIKNNQLYLNIPDHLLDKPMLFVRYEQNTNRQYMQVVWSLYMNQLILKAPAIQSTAGITLPIGEKLTLKENILAVFPLNNTHPQWRGLTINITDFLLTQNIEWSPGYSESMVPSITMLMESKDLIDEVIVKINKGLIQNNIKISVPMHYAFCMLPDPMPARHYDYRMGFFNEKLNDISYLPHNSIANISRWRLEKLHKYKEISVPKKPITFIMSPDIPHKWRPFVRAGIEEWLPAFEAAGFKDALVIQENDSLSEWQTKSIHTSMIYWQSGYNFRGEERGGYGGTIANIIDERTGEILKSDVFIGNSREAYSERYFIRAAPLDKRAQKFPFPDELLGELYQSLVAHEVGHSFGLMDSHYGQNAYPIEKMNDISWLASMGHTPSVMNYTRQNNVAQPKDSIPPNLLNQKVGPTDRYMIKWGYMEFSPEISEMEEEAVLESLIRLQDSIPWYRHSRSSNGMGPGTTYEVVDCRNVVQSTIMVLKNLERVMELIPEACSNQKDNARMERLYESTLDLWNNKMLQVVYLVGGYDIHMKPTNLSGSRYEPISMDYQMKSLEFLMQHVLYPPKWLTNPPFETRINYTVNRDMILQYQTLLVFELLNPLRMKRLEYMNDMNGFDGIYKRFFTSLQLGVFRELYDGSRNVPRRKQEIQLTYLDFLVRNVNKERINISIEEKNYDYTDYSKGLMLEQLMDIKNDIKRKLKQYKGNVSVGHWNNCLLSLQEIP
ncbi:zinc-dependent metalloprotease [Gelidibacter gilvus]|nr:zinc-dependent metalloprotease [Gelidibacter gilvus]